MFSLFFEKSRRRDRPQICGKMDTHALLSVPLDLGLLAHGWADRLRHRSWQGRRLAIRRAPRAAGRRKADSRGAMGCRFALPGRCGLWVMHEVLFWCSFAFRSRRYRHFGCGNGLRRFTLGFRVKAPSSFGIRPTAPKIDTFSKTHSDSNYLTMSIATGQSATGQQNGHPMRTQCETQHGR